MALIHHLQRRLIVVVFGSTNPSRFILLETTFLPTNLGMSELLLAWPEVIANGRLIFLRILLEPPYTIMKNHKVARNIWLQIITMHADANFIVLQLSNFQEVLVNQISSASRVLKFIPKEVPKSLDKSPSFAHFQLYPPTIHVMCILIKLVGTWLVPINIHAGGFA